MQINSNKSTVVAGELDGAGHFKKLNNTAISFSNNNQVPIRNIKSGNEIRKLKPDFKAINKIALHHSLLIIARLLPNGFIVKGNYISSNPYNSEQKACSFKVNLTNGKWVDYESREKGKGIISLTTYLLKTSEFDATLRLAKFLGVEV